MSVIPISVLVVTALSLSLPTTALAQSEPSTTEQSIAQEAENCRSAGQFSEAERLLQKKIALDEQVYGSDSGQMAEDLDTLSHFLTEDKKYDQAEKALRDALNIFTSIEGPQRTTNTFYLSRLANLAAHQQRFAEAEQLCDQIWALETAENGFEHPETLEQLAEVYRLAKDYSKAEGLYMQVIGSKSAGATSGELLGEIERLGAMYEEEGKSQQAEALYLNAVYSSQHMEAPGDLVLIANLNDLASFYDRQQRLYDADEYYKLALEQFDGIPSDGGLMDHNLAIVMSNYAETLRKQNRTGEAEQDERRADSIEKHLQQGRPVCKGGN